MPEHQYFINLMALLGLPNWIIFLTGLVGLFGGLVVGRFYSLQAKAGARLIELGTRNNQSEFDLVSRDVIKAKQDTIKQLESLKSTPGTSR